MYMDEDSTLAILLQRSVESCRTTPWSLHDRLAQIASEALLNLYDSLRPGIARIRKKRTRDLCTKLKREHGLIDWSESAERSRENNSRVQSGPARSWKVDRQNLKVFPFIVDLNGQPERFWQRQRLIVATGKRTFSRRSAT